MVVGEVSSPRPGLRQRVAERISSELPREPREGSAETVWDHSGLCPATVILLGTSPLFFLGGGSPPFLGGGG